MLKSLIEAGVIAQRDGRWVVTGDPTGISVPDTVQGVHDDAHRRIAGRDQAHAATSRRHRTDFSRSISWPKCHGCAAGRQNTWRTWWNWSLSSLALATSTTLEICSARKWPITVCSSPNGRRCTAHCRCTGAPASRADRLESQYATLADHYERGGLWPKALEYRHKGRRTRSAALRQLGGGRSFEPGDGRARAAGNKGRRVC